MEKVIKLKILTPQKTVFSGDASEVVVTTEAGEITVLPNHSPIISVLKTGEVRIKKIGESSFTPMTISSGVLEVKPDCEVVILASRSESVTDLDLYRAEEAYARAKKAMEEERDDLTEEAFSKYQSLIEKEFNRVKVFKKYRGK